MSVIEKNGKEKHKVLHDPDKNKWKLFWKIRKIFSIINLLVIVNARNLAFPPIHHFCISHFCVAHFSLLYFLLFSGEKAKFRCTFNFHLLFDKIKCSKYNCNLLTQILNNIFEKRKLCFNNHFLQEEVKSRK